MDFPAYEPVSDLLTKLLPGSSPCILELRVQVLSFCANLAARTLHLSGHIGVGKSRLARIIGYLRRIVPLSRPEAIKMIGDFRTDASGSVDLRQMPWYVEISLTGLVE